MRQSGMYSAMNSVLTAGLMTLGTYMVQDHLQRLDIFEDLDSDSGSGDGGGGWDHVYFGYDVGQYF